VHQHGVGVMHARQCRVGGLKSTLVVPHSAHSIKQVGVEIEPGVDASAGAENDSKRNRSTLLVTTGSAARMRAATICGGS